MKVSFTLGSVYGSFIFFFFLICIRDFSRVFQHYQACQVDHDIIFFWQIKLNVLQTSENDGSRTYTSLVKSTEDSDIEYMNQLLASDYVNV